MDLLLIFFAIPIAIIILSIIFESFIRCPLKIAGIVFSIFLIITFAIGNELLLIATIVYTLIAFLSAWLYEIFIRNNNGCGNNNCGNSSCGSCDCGNNGCGNDNSENSNCRNSYLNNSVENNYFNNRSLLESNNLKNSEIEVLSQYENNCCNKKYRY